MISMINWYEIPEPSLEPPEEDLERDEFDEDRFYDEKRELELFGDNW